MKQHLITPQRSPRLILFFAGWGMDETPFLHYRPQEADLMLCYDYRRMDFDDTWLMNYEEIRLIGWSMGVWAASQVLSPRGELPITRRIAVNGTPYPVDQERGIPPTIFQGTLQGLNASTLLKFQRRMCANAEAFARFQAMAPRRTWEELKEELAAIGKQCQIAPLADFGWDEAFIGNNDRIFPPQAQHKAWEEICPRIVYGNEAHYDNTLFQSLITQSYE